MLTREDQEERERNTLSPYAMCSNASEGRLIQEEPCALRTEYQRDRDRIVHSKAFRRLMHKTQVFLAPEGDHFRTRLTHTLEVSQIARTISRSLGLNEDLTEAIALGHDLGHTPFGHNGEEELNQKHPGGFRHNVQSLRVVDILEFNGIRKGMNLTSEVRDGILNHTGEQLPKTLEGQVVRFSDRIAYINHDIDDAMRGGIIREGDLPKEAITLLGSSHRERINTLVTNLVRCSQGQSRILMEDQVLTAMNRLRSYMFREVYYSNRVKKEEDLAQVKHIIFRLYDHFSDHPEELPQESQDMILEYGIPEVVKDHIAGMTDRYALQLYSKIFSEQKRNLWDFVE